MAKAKIFQLWICDGTTSPAIWRISESFADLDLANIVFEWSTLDFNQYHPKREWHNFSYKIVNKETGKVERRHIGKIAKYARND